MASASASDMIGNLHFERSMRPTLKTAFRGGGTGSPDGRAPCSTPDLRMTRVRLRWSASVTNASMSCLASERRTGRCSLVERPRLAVGCAIRNPVIGVCFALIRKSPFRPSIFATRARTCHAARRRMSPNDVTRLHARNLARIESRRARAATEATRRPNRPDTLGNTGTVPLHRHACREWAHRNRSVAKRSIQIAVARRVSAPPYGRPLPMRRCG